MYATLEPLTVDRHSQLPSHLLVGKTSRAPSILSESSLVSESVSANSQSIMAIITYGVSLSTLLAATAKFLQAWFSRV